MRLRFKEHKNELKMTWEQYLEDTDVSPNTMMTWLRGANHPSVISVEIIAYKHKVNPAWLVGWSDRKERK